MKNNPSNQPTKGYIHVYTGNGKGKTTAAFGLAIRAAMAGKKVYIGQFIKSMAYNETKIASLVSSIEIEQLGDGCFINTPPKEEDQLCAQKALQKSILKMQSGEYDVVILDEIHIALYFKLIDLDVLLKALEEKPLPVEVVLTGRYAPDALIEAADLVTEMKEIKHYYTKGVLSREGIDK